MSRRARDLARGRVPGGRVTPGSRGRARTANVPSLPDSCTPWRRAGCRGRWRPTPRRPRQPPEGESRRRRANPPPRARRPLEAQMAPVVSVRSSYPAAMPRNVDLLAVNWNPPSRCRPHRQHHKRTGARYRACLAPDIPVRRVFAPFGTSVRSPWAQTAHLQRHRASQSRRVPPPHEQAPQNQAPAAKCPESPSGVTMATNAEVMYCFYLFILTGILVTATRLREGARGPASQ